MRIWKYIFTASIIIPHSANAIVELTKVSYPKTIADVPREVRIENEKIGYAPYANTSAYVPIELESEEEAMERHIARLEAIAKLDAINMSHDDYCEKYPTDEEKCVQTPGLEEQIIAIGSAPIIQIAQPVVPGAPAVQGATTPAAPTPSMPGTPNASVAPAVATSGQLVGYSMSGQPVYANPTIVGGPCTPPETDDTGWPNKIYTSGKYQSIDQGFEKIMTIVFRKEGACGNDPDDAGGFTCFGISSRANPDIDVANLTRPKVEDIAYDRYYKKYNIDKLPDSIRDVVFLTMWGSGPAYIKKFQRFLGVPATGKIDDTTINAAKNYQGDIRERYLDNRQQQLVEASKKGNNRKFLKGWMRGIKLYRKNGCHYPTQKPLKRE